METKERISDAEIIDFYWKREEKAIQATDSKYGSYLSTIGNNILNDRFECEECLDDTYMATWNTIPPQRPDILQKYLSKIMRNISIDLYRKKSAKKRIESELTLSLDELGDCIVMGDTAEDADMLFISNILNSFLGDIDKEERFIFICRYYYSDSVKYIANLIGKNTRAVYRQLSTLRERLRSRLEKGGISV